MVFLQAAVDSPTSLTETDISLEDNDLTQKLAEIKGSYKIGYAKLQQQLNSIESSNETKLLSLEKAFKEGTQKLEKKLALAETQIKTEKENTHTVEKRLEKLLFELQLKTEENLKLQSTVYEQTIALKEMKERQHDLQSNVRNLEDILKKSESDRNRKIFQYTKEIQLYKNLTNVEKEERIKAQQTLARVSLELKENENETLVLRKNQDELLLTIQKLEDALKSTCSSVKQKVRNSLLSINSTMYSLINN